MRMAHDGEENFGVLLDIGKCPADIPQGTSIEDVRPL